MNITKLSFQLFIVFYCIEIVKIIIMQFINIGIGRLALSLDLMEIPISNFRPNRCLDLPYHMEAVHLQIEIPISTGLR